MNAIDATTGPKACRLRPMNPLESLVGSMTLAELSAKTGTSVADIVAFASKQRTSAPKAKPTKAAKSPAPKAKAKAPSKGVNTRTAEGRAAYDAAVRAWLKEHSSKQDPQPASAVIEACGGTGLQARTTLARLIEAKKARFVGKARATKYWAT